MSSGSVSKYEFLTGKDVVPEKDLLEKAAAIKKFEYSPFEEKLEESNYCCRKTVSKIWQCF